jgi:hypothetical protein
MNTKAVITLQYFAGIFRIAKARARLNAKKVRLRT